MAIASDFRSGTGGLADTTDATTYTFTAADVGTASSDRYVLVGVSGRGAANRTINSVTVGGVTATALGTQIDNSGSSSRFYIVAFPTGTTADIVITVSSTWLRCHIGVWALTGVDSGLTAYDAQSDTTFSSAVVSVSMNCPAGGAIYVLANNLGANSAGWGTWVGVTTERYDATIESGGRSAGASNDFASAQSGLTVSATAASSVGTIPVFVAISLAPPSAQTVTPSFFTNTSAFGTPVVTPGAVTIEPTKFTNTSVFFTPVVAGGAISVLPTKFTNSSSFGTPVITTTAAPYRPQVRSGMYRRHMGW